MPDMHKRTLIKTLSTLHPQHQLFNTTFTMKRDIYYLNDTATTRACCSLTNGQLIPVDSKVTYPGGKQINTWELCVAPKVGDSAWVDQWTKCYTNLGVPANETGKLEADVPNAAAGMVFGWRGVVGVVAAGACAVLAVL